MAIDVNKLIYDIRTGGAAPKTPKARNSGSTTQKSSASTPTITTGNKDSDATVARNIEGLKRNNPASVAAMLAGSQSGDIAPVKSPKSRFIPHDTQKPAGKAAGMKAYTDENDALETELAIAQNAYRDAAYREQAEKWDEDHRRRFYNHYGAWANKVSRELQSTRVNMGDAVSGELDAARKGVAEMEDYLRKQGYSQDEINSFRAYARQQDNSSKMYENARYWQDVADEGFWGKVAASVASIPANLISGMAYADALLQRITNPTDAFTGATRAVDYNASPVAYASENMRSAVSKDMSAAGQFFYSTGMSIADFIAAGGIMKATGAVGKNVKALGKFGTRVGNSAEVMLAGSAANAGMRAAKERGATDAEALGFGFLNGLAEMAGEHMSIEHLGTIERAMGNAAGRRSTANIFKSIGLQAAVEGSEEGVTTIANTLADLVIMGDRSEYNLNVEKYLAAGETDEDARRHAFLDWLGGLALDVAGGAISGGVTSGVTIGISAAKQKASGAPNVEDKPAHYETAQSAKVRNAESTQSAQAPAQPVDASQVIADMVTGKTGTRSDTAGQNTPQGGTKVNIDNAARPVYTGDSNINGGAQNVSGRSLEADSDGISGVYDSGDTEHQGRSGLSGNSVASGFVLSEQARNAIQSRGVDIVETKDVSANSAAFSAALDESRAANAQNGWAVTPKSTQEIAENGVRVYMNDSASAGYGIAPDGDIEAVFANKSKGAPRHALASMMPQAIANGGTKLDCYGEGLVRIYSRYGFTPVARVQFNAEYANEGWAPDKGAPDIYFMMATDLDPDSVAQNFGNYPVLTQAQLDALPVMDYDKAYTYRDELLAQQQSNLPKGTGAAELGFTGNREMNTSRYRSNTIERSYDPESVSDYGMEADNPSFQYEVKPEGQTLSRAQRLFNQLTEEDGISAVEEWLLEKQEWTAEDADLAEIATREITRQLEEGLDDPDMSISEYNELAEIRANIAHEKSAHMSNAGQVIQTLAKWTRESEDSGAAAGDTAISAIIENENLSEQERYDAVRQVVRWQALLEGSNPNTKQGRSDLTHTIMEIGEQRGVLNWATIRSKRAEITRSMVEKSLNALSGEDLQALAYNSLAQVGNDQVYSADVGKKMKCVQMLAMLSNPKTKLVNISGNSVFSVIDTVAMNGSALADQIMSSMTGTRSVAADKGIFDAEGWKAARTALNRTIAEIALDVDMGTDSRYQNTGYTFKANGNIFDRVLHVLERNQKYGMVLPDEIAKGFASGRHKAAMERLIAEGKVTEADADYAQSYADKIAKYRTFQNDSWLATMLGGVHDGLNVIGVGDSGKRIKGREKDYKVGSFGVGDIVAPFTRVAGNLVSTAVDYTPIGFARGFAEACSVVYNAKRSGKPNHNKQAQAVQHMGRGATGTAVIALFAAISATGLLRRADDEDDPDVAALNAAEGISGTQLNISALSRALAGESTEWRNGDELLDLSRFEPVNSIMALGTIVSTWNEDTTFGDKASSSFNALLESAAELPVIQNIQTLAVNTIKYKQDFGEALAEMFVKTATSSVIPNISRQFARGIDPYYRDVYSGDSLGENLLDNAKNSLPGLRETLPVKLDPFGDEKEYGDSTLTNILNAMVNPIGLNTYSQRDVSKEMERIKNETSRVDMYPDKTAPTKIDYGGSSYDMTYEERQQYLRTAGEQTEKLYSQLINSSAYRRLSDDQKADAMADLAKASRSEAKMEFLKSRGIVGRDEEANVSSWVKLAKNNPRKTAEYFLDSQYLHSTDTNGNGNFSNAEKVRGLIAGGYSGAQLTEKVREYMTSDSGNCALGDYLERAQAANVPDSIALDVYEFNSGAHADKDENGKSISGSKKAKVAEYINSQQLTAAQKRALYYSLYKK